MNTGYIIKSITALDDDLGKINRYTRRNLSADGVYTFSVILCDNEIDRDYERFCVDSLNSLAKLFIGKTGIFDHNPKGQNQTARIYDTEVLVDKLKRTSLNEEYTYLKAKAYMVKSDKNADLILEIDGGIKKEVSVGCSVSSIKCSVCAADAKKGCKHQKGKVYEGTQCHHILEKPTDAYEWSFVAVPAQKNAGVTKSYENQDKEDSKLRDNDTLIKAFSVCDEEFTLTKAEAMALCSHIKCLEKTAELGFAYKQDLAKEVTRLSFLANDQLDTAVFASVASKMDIEELKAFKSAYEKKLSSFEDNVQLKGKDKTFTQATMNEFKI